MLSANSKIARPDAKPDRARQRDVAIARKGFGVMSRRHPYQHEAELIAASVVKERGHEWKASQIQQGKRPQDEAVVIALRALMVARGELEIRYDHGLATR